MNRPAPANPGPAPRIYLPFIDWMKCVGMFLIVMGHVASRPTNHLLPPIYAKQLGVAFFIFVMGYSLASETKPARRVLFDRLFEIYLWGWTFALLSSAAMFVARGTLQLSNYEPLLFGVNVVVDNFPANPTTWYIGTYLHILLLWAVVLRRLRVRPWMVAAAVAAEVDLRALLIGAAGRYVAYMLLSNWISVFLLGQLLGQREAATATAGSRRRRWQAPGALLLLAVFLLAWYRLVGPTVRDYTFPFMRLSLGRGPEQTLLTALGVSAVYLTVTWLVFRAVMRLPKVEWVCFFARSTLVIFIAHMPLYYLLDGRLSRTAWSYAGRSMVYLLACFLGLALLSEALVRGLEPRTLRDRIRRRVLHSA
jgi:fucose 4-O-acetylase-like acetyltransferase